MFLNAVFIVTCMNFVLKANGQVSEEEYNLMPKLFYLDDFDYCMTLKDDALYCSVAVQLSPHPSKPSKIWKIIQEVTSHKRNYRHDLLRHGICVTKFCPKTASNITIYKNNESLLQKAISECYSDKYKDQGLKGHVTELHCETDEPFYPFDIYGVIVGLLVALVFALVGAGTVYEGSVKYLFKNRDAKKESVLQELASCFSVFNNWKQLFSISSDLEADPLKCMGGFRFYSTLLVVISHTIFVELAIGIANPQYHENLTQDPWNMIFMNGSYLVQSYLLITGWILTYQFFVTFEDYTTGKLRYLLLSFINRIIRMTPCLLLVTVVEATWLYHLGRGPYWDKVVGDSYRNCRINWWTNLLYINNYYNVEHICIQQSWYFAADLQLYAFSLILISFMWKYEHRAKLMLSASIFVAVLIPGIVNYVYEFDMLNREYPEPMYKWFLTVPEWTVMFTAGYTNVGGCLIGVLFGYVHYNCRQRTLFTKKVHFVLFWVLLWALPLGAIFTAAPIYLDSFVYTRLGAAVFVSIGRNLFALGIAIAIFGISHGVGWFMRDCVVWSPVLILGKLSYCVFLSHLSLIRVRVGLKRKLSYISTYDMFTQSLGDVVLSYVLGLILCLCVEMPTATLQKFLMEKFRKKEDKNDISINEESGMISKF